MFIGMRHSFKMVLTTSKVPGVAIFQNGCQIWLQKSIIGHNFTNKYHYIMIFSSQWMSMDITYQFKIVLTSSTVPGVTIVRNGCQSRCHKLFLAIKFFKIIDIESWIIGHIFSNNCDIIMICGYKYMFMDIRNSCKKVLTSSTVLVFTIFLNGCQNGP